MTHRARTLVIVTALLLVSACAAHRSRTGQIAQHADTIGKTISQVLTTTTQLRESGVIQPEQSLKVAQLAKQASDAGLKLDGALRLLDSGQPQDTQTIKGLVDQIGNAVLGIVAVVGDTPATQQVRTLLQTVLQTTNIILSQLGGAQ